MFGAVRLFCALLGVVSEDDGVGADDLSKGYDYLLGMKLWSLTLERVRHMENDLQQKTEEMAMLKVPLSVACKYCTHKNVVSM